MKLFSYRDHGAVLLCWGFNRGHAVKQIAKFVEARGHEFSKDSRVEEVAQPEDEKGSVVVLLSPPEWSGTPA
jgi:hypothetical protein